jgi:hypothetical protein
MPTNTISTMPPPFMLDANSLSVYQRCRRRWLIDRTWRPRRQHPKSAFDRLLRQGVLRLEAGEDATVVAQSLRTAFLKQAASPGLDFTRDAYTEAMEWAGMLEVVIEAVSRSPLEVTRPSQPVALSADVSWLPLARVDDSGCLHRWLTVDALDSDRLAAELHSWQVFGDIAAADAPLTLHVVVIGSVRDSGGTRRRHSPWCRAWAHPVIVGRLKMQRTGGRKLSGEQWKPVWRTDMPQMTAHAWVDLMAKEEALPGVIHHLSVAAVSPAHREQFVREMAQEAEAMRRLLPTATSRPAGADILDPVRASADFWQVPMSRPACDGWRPCPYQPVCYGPVAVPIESLGAYEPRPAAALRPAAPATGPVTLR